MFSRLFILANLAFFYIKWFENCSLERKENGEIFQAGLVSRAGLGPVDVSHSLAADMKRRDKMPLSRSIQPFVGSLAGLLYTLYLTPNRNVALASRVSYLLGASVCFSQYICPSKL